jgi:hypothetical protein
MQFACEDRNLNQEDHAQEVGIQNTQKTWDPSASTDKNPSNEAETSILLPLSPQRGPIK